MRQLLLADVTEEDKQTLYKETMKYLGRTLR